MRTFSTLLLGALLAQPALAQPAQPIKEILPRFEAVAKQLFEESGVPGASIGIVYKDEVIFLKSYGVREAGKPELVDADTVFQVASMSKPITSTALASLVSKGVMSWDDRIQTLLPELKLQDSWVSERATFRDLMSHRSGIPEGGGDLLEDLGADQATILHQLRLLPSAYDFRAGYAYTNYGYTSAGVAGARAADLSFDDMMDRELFTPLGMSSSSTRYSDYIKRANRAHAHTIAGGKAIPTVRQPDAQAPAGGVSTSTNDSLRWMRLHLNKGKADGKQLISEQALLQTYKVHSLASNNPATFSGSGFYGLGWGVAFDQKDGALRLSHSGAFFTGIRTEVTLIPDEDLGIVVLSNAFPSSLPESVSYNFLELYNGGHGDLAHAQAVGQQVTSILQEMSAPPVRPRRVGRPSPALSLDAYTGSFTNSFFGPAVVSKSGNGLSIKLGKKTLPLRHLDRDTFVFESKPGEFEDITIIEISFVVDGNGQTSGFRQVGLNESFPWFSKAQP